MKSALEASSSFLDEISKDPPLPPPRLGEEGRGPEPPASWRPLPADEPGFPGARPISCLQPFVWRRGAAERQRGSAPGGRSGGPCHAEAARRELGKLAQPTAFPFQRKRALPPPPPFTEGWVRPATCCLRASVRICLPLLPAAEAGGGPSARALCWPCP